MRKLDLDSLQIFQAVAHCGGITKAAAQLHRVQSNVSTRLQQLEARLGVALFLRQGGKLQLSAEGQVLLGYADRLLRLAHEAEQALQHGGPRGTLRLGTLESTAAARLPPLLSHFHAAYPEVQIELVTGSSSRLLGLVQRAEVDAAFIAEPIEGTGLARQHAYDETLVVIAPREARDVLAPAQLQGSTVIAFATGCSYRRVLDTWLSSVSVLPARVLELASYHAIVACVAAGSGIAIMPRSVLQAVHAGPELQVLPLPDRFTLARTYLVWPAGHSTTALSALQQALANTPAVPPVASCAQA